MLKGDPKASGRQWGERCGLLPCPKGNNQILLTIVMDGPHNNNICTIYNLEASSLKIYQMQTFYKMYVVQPEELFNTLYNTSEKLL